MIDSDQFEVIENKIQQKLISLGFICDNGKFSKNDFNVIIDSMPVTSEKDYIMIKIKFIFPSSLTDEGREFADHFLLELESVTSELIK